MKEVVIVSAARTPFGKMGGALKPLKATDLGGMAIKDALRRAGIEGNQVDEVIYGMVVPAGQGQIPGRQASVKGGIPHDVPVVTINKVCGSALKAVTLGAQIIKAGDADGQLAGARNTTGNVLRPALQIIKTVPGITCVSGAMLLLTHAPEYGNNGVLVMGDVAVTPMPDANQLAQIAVCTAQTAKAVAGIDPRVALLSFSTKGSAKHEVVDKVVEALSIAKEMAPDLKIDGELQADAALVPHIGASKAPGSEIAGKANVLVVPCLEVGNISYKLVERLGHATAIGPILQGIARPVNDLSRGCSIDDVYKMIAITANQAIAAKANN